MNRYAVCSWPTRQSTPQSMWHGCDWRSGSSSPSARRPSTSTAPSSTTSSNAPSMTSWFRYKISPLHSPLPFFYSCYLNSFVVNNIRWLMSLSAGISGTESTGRPLPWIRRRCVVRCRQLQWLSCSLPLSCPPPFSLSLEKATACIHLFIITIYLVHINYCTLSPLSFPSHF